MKHYEINIKYQSKKIIGKRHEMSIFDIEAESEINAIKIAKRSLIRFYYDWFLLKLKDKDITIIEVNCKRRSRW